MYSVIGAGDDQIRIVAESNLYTFRDTINSFLKAGWFVVAEPRPYFENGTYVAFVTDGGTKKPPPDIPMETIDPVKHLPQR